MLGTLEESGHIARTGVREKKKTVLASVVAPLGYERQN